MFFSEIIHPTYKLYTNSEIKSPNLHNLSGKPVTQEAETAIQISNNQEPKYPEVAQAYFDGLGFLLYSRDGPSLA